ncbi:MAG: hypothetical protein O3A48_00445 [Actinomycetota bacterium]|nr:hypothetical protein [Actinomycetota bacterium]MDA3012997.1 hypothetical protein [Actinomycetota bacterium]
MLIYLGELSSKKIKSFLKKFLIGFDGILKVDDRYSLLYLVPA